ncbi:unnamed protein product [Brachionus calyciflorus]|uniref:Uncharacterized protein n=1 Tax=Brachionus calyciflorus TaxID=104777 RepID=A0A814R250_9BILA|nr:unnamed protein product [Brachionus calyciflorus]
MKRVTSIFDKDRSYDGDEDVGAFNLDNSKEEISLNLSHSTDQDDEIKEKQRKNFDWNMIRNFDSDEH